MRHTKAELQDAIRLLREKASTVQERSAVERLVYLLGPESTWDALCVAGDKTPDVLGAVVDDISETLFGL